jgi:hypothetical protein
MKRMLQKLTVSLLSLTLVGPLLLPSTGATGQEAIGVTAQAVDYDFRDHLTFTATIESAAEITAIELLYRIAGRPATSRNKADLTPGSSPSEVSAEFKLDQTKPENYFPPGTELEYWWRITTADGNELRTDRQTLLYLDNRYDWQTLENERLALYWYEGGNRFGQALFDRANKALDTLATDFGVALADPIKIFIYASHRDLLGAISTSSQEWTGGQAFPNYGVVLIGVAPSQLNWGLDATTHEISHLVIHQATDNPYGDLPRWLDEGIAVYNENREELDEDFRAVFEEAVRNNQLLTLRTLSSPFPADPMLANLAYGQSGAVVKFIIDTYGPEAMAHLLEIFAEGAIYDQALQEALGVDTDGLDNAFRASLGLPPLPGTEVEAPAATELNSATTEADSPAKVEEAAGVEPESAAAPAVDTSAAVAPAEPEPETAPAETGGSSLALPCLAGLVPLLVVGWWSVVRKRS